MKIKLVFGIVVLCNAITFANLSITKECNLPRNGDVLVKQLVVNASVGAKGDGVVWDFSNASIVDGNYSVKYGVYGDTLTRVTEKGTRYDYKMAGDTLLWQGFENRLSIVRDSVAAAAIRFPFAYGDSIARHYIQKGRYSKNLNIYLEGVSEVVCDARGTVILPSCDTLANVLRVHRTNNSLMKIDGRFRSDSCSIDSLPRHIEEIYNWYAEGYRYPIVEIKTHKYQAQGKEVNSNQAAFLCPPNEQGFLKDDPENRSKRDIASNRNNNRNGNQGRWGDSSDTNGTGENVNADVSLSQTQGSVTVSYTANRNMTIGATLTDLYGRVFGFIPDRTVDEGEEYNTTLDTSGLIPGEYLLHIALDELRQIKKFNVK